MSRLARKPIQPGKTTVTVDGGTLTVKGTKGTLTKPMHRSVTISVNPEGVMVERADRSRMSKALVGTYAAHLKNMIHGVETPFERKLIIEGVGYRAEMKGKELVLQVGFSHPVSLAIPEGLTVAVEKNVISVSGIDKDVVGQFSANVRRVKPPEPYLGKGIRYENEVVRRKQGKKAA